MRLVYFTCVNKRLIIFLIFLFFKSCIFSKSSKTLFIKKLFTKNIFTNIIFWIIGYWKKSCIRICSKIIYKNLSTIVCQAILSPGRTSMDGDDITTSEKNIKNEGLASVKKWKFSFRKTEIIQMSSFSLAYTPKKTIWPSVIQLLPL